MTADLRPCARDDLVAIVHQQTFWHVNDTGETGDFRSGDEFAGIEQYGCFNCGRWFAPEDADRPTDWDKAWQAALDHLSKPETLEPAAVSCCLPSVHRRTSRSDTA